MIRGVLNSEVIDHYTKRNISPDRQNLYSPQDPDLHLLPGERISPLVEPCTALCCHYAMVGER